MQKSQSGKTLLDVDSAYQNIIVENKPNDGLTLYLDGAIQFSERTENIYHNTLGKYPLLRNPNIRKVFIMGGGDGLLARTMFDAKPSLDITVCELDPMMIDIFKRVSSLRRLNKGSLLKTRNITDDALKIVKMLPNASFDLVVSDFPDYNVGTTRLYSPSLYTDVARILRRRGMLSIYTGGRTPEVKRDLGLSFNMIKTMFIKPPTVGSGYILNAIKRGK